VISNKIVLNYLLDVESKSGTHEHREFDEEHVPAEVVQGVGEGQSPEGDRGQDVLPGNGQLRRRLKKLTILSNTFQMI